jgi:hypothetical protein
MSTAVPRPAVRRIEPDTAEAVIVTFDVPEALRAGVRFTQGQYLTLRKTIDGQDLRRSYSICAGVDDGELRVGVRKVKAAALLELDQRAGCSPATPSRDGAAGPLLRAAGAAGASATTWASPAAAASRRSCRS